MNISLFPKTIVVMVPSVKKMQIPISSLCLSFLSVTSISEINFNFKNRKKKKIGKIMSNVNRRGKRIFNCEPVRPVFNKLTTRSIGNQK